MGKFQSSVIILQKSLFSLWVKLVSYTYLCPVVNDKALS